MFRSASGLYEFILGQTEKEEQQICFANQEKKKLAIAQRSKQHKIIMLSC